MISTACGRRVWSMISTAPSPAAQIVRCGSPLISMGGATARSLPLVGRDRPRQRPRWGTAAPRPTLTASPSVPPHKGEGVKVRRPSFLPQGETLRPQRRRAAGRPPRAGRPRPCWARSARAAPAAASSARPPSHRGRARRSRRRSESGRAGSAASITPQQCGDPSLEAGLDLGLRGFGCHQPGRYVQRPVEGVDRRRDEAIQRRNAGRRGDRRRRQAAPEWESASQIRMAALSVISSPLGSCERREPAPVDWPGRSPAERWGTSSVR